MMTYPLWTACRADDDNDKDEKEKRVGLGTSEPAEWNDLRVPGEEEG